MALATSTRLRIFAKRMPGRRQISPAWQSVAPGRIIDATIILVVEWKIAVGESVEHMAADRAGQSVRAGRVHRHAEADLLARQQPKLTMEGQHVAGMGQYAPAIDILLIKAERHAVEGRGRLQDRIVHPMRRTRRTIGRRHPGSSGSTACSAGRHRDSYNQGRHTDGRPLPLQGEAMGEAEFSQKRAGMLSAPGREGQLPSISAYVRPRAQWAGALSGLI